MFEQPFMMAWDSINRGGGISWDYEDDFTTDKMTDDGTAFNYNAGTDVQDFTVPNTLGAPQSYVDMLGGIVSGTLWEFRAKLTINTYSVNTTGTIKRNFIGIFSSTSGMTTGQDGVFFDYGSESSLSHLKIGNTDGAAPNVNTGDNLTTATSATTFFLALLRQSATLQYISLSSTSAYTEDIETITKAVASSTVNLRYLQHSNRSGNANGTIIGTFDDVFFANGVNYL